MKGLVFDIEEFAVFDGPGIRSVIFLKGCPLRCQWCHNPEGLSALPQQVRTLALCQHCGACDAVCPAPTACTGCGTCVKACPAGCLHIAGTWMDAEEVASRIRRQEKLLTLNGGGVTFSGGEPLAQPDFILAVRKALPTLHACLETSGHAPPKDFLRVIQQMDFIIMDLKQMDSALHKKYTGVSNALILQNLTALIQSGKPFRIRVPLIPGVNDTPAHLSAVAERLRGVPTLEKVELLPYNRAAGAKYAGAGMTYHPLWDEAQKPTPHLTIFQEASIPCDVL